MVKLSCILYVCFRLFIISSAMTTNNKTEDWGEEMDRLNPYIESNGSSEDTHKPIQLAEVQEESNGSSEDTLDQKQLAEVQEHHQETEPEGIHKTTTLAEAQKKSPEETKESNEVVATAEPNNIRTRNVGSNTEEELDSEITEVRNLRIYSQMVNNVILGMDIRCEGEGELGYTNPRRKQE